MIKNKKITKATFKKFLRDNKNLYIRNISSFNGMIDGHSSECDNGFTRLEKIKEKKYISDNNLGYVGVYLVGGSRDYFTYYENELLEGIYVSNCCDYFIVARDKNFN